MQLHLKLSENSAVTPDNQWKDARKLGLEINLSFTFDYYN
jgi:hypothetical protein